MKDKSKPIGEIKNSLKKFREEYNKDEKILTQEELANMLGITRQTVIAMEKGSYKPSLELAFKIARVFNVKIEDIFQYIPGE